MAQELEAYLLLALKRLDKAADEVMKTQGLTEETETLKLLAEMVREQVGHEDSRPATGTAR